MWTLNVRQVRLPNLANYNSKCLKYWKCKCQTRFSARITYRMDSQVCFKFGFMDPPFIYKMVNNSNGIPAQKFRYPSLIRNSKFSTNLTVQGVRGKKVNVLHTVPLLGRGQLNFFFQWFAEKRDSVNPFNSKLLLNLKQTGRYIYPSHNSKAYVRVILKRDMYLITHGERML